jgi:hypothetical protein
VKGIIPYVYPRKRVICGFKMPFVIQEHRNEKNYKGRIVVGGPWDFFKSRICE